MNIIVVGTYICRYIHVPVSDGAQLHSSVVDYCILLCQTARAGVREGGADGRRGRWKEGERGNRVFNFLQVFGE